MTEKQLLLLLLSAAVIPLQGKTRRLVTGPAAELKGMHLSSRWLEDRRRSHPWVPQGTSRSCNSAEALTLETLAEVVCIHDVRGHVIPCGSSNISMEGIPAPTLKPNLNKWI